jgi:hypothetical protein
LKKERIYTSERKKGIEEERDGVALVGSYVTFGNNCWNALCYG